MKKSHIRAFSILGLASIVGVAGLCLGTCNSILIKANAYASNQQCGSITFGNSDTDIFSTNEVTDSSAIQSTLLPSSVGSVDIDSWYTNHCYRDGDGYNVLIGTNSSSGALVLNFDNEISVRSIRLYISLYSSDPTIICTLGSETASASGVEMNSFGMPSDEETDSSKYTYTELTFDSVATGTQLRIANAGGGEIFRLAKIVFKFEGDGYTPPVTETYSLVNSISEIKANDSVIVAANYGGTYYALSNTLVSGWSYFLNGIEVNVSGNTITTSDSSLSWTLGGSSTDGWSLYNSQYFYGYTSGSRYRVGLTDTERNWTFSIDDQSRLSMYMSSVYNAFQMYSGTTPEFYGNSSKGAYDLYLFRKGTAEIDVVAEGDATSLEIGSSLQMSLTVDGVATSNVSWAIDDDSKALITSSGLLIGVGEGTVTVSATYSGTVYPLTLTVNNTNSLVFQGISWLDNTPDTTSYSVGESFDSNGMRVKAGFSNGVYYDVTSDVNLSYTYASGANYFASISDSVTVSGSWGSYNLAGTTPVVTISPSSNPVTSIVLSDSGSKSISVGSTYQISATVYPNNASVKTLSYSVPSAYSSYISVDSNGLVTAIAVGTGYVIVSATDGSGVSATMTINVVEGEQIDKYVHVTSTSDLVVGSKYVVASAYDGAVRTMNSSLTGTDAGVVNDDGAIAIPNDACVFTLGGSSGSYTLYDEDLGKYLGIGSLSSSSTSLAITATTISSGSSYLEYAENEFTSYSKHSPVFLYKLSGTMSEDEVISNTSVRIAHSFASGSTGYSYKLVKSGSSYVASVKTTYTKGESHTDFNDVEWVAGYFNCFDITDSSNWPSNYSTNRSGASERQISSYNRTSGYVTSFGGTSGYYYEVDIAGDSYYGSNRGVLRLVVVPNGAGSCTGYSSEQVIFYTPDHYGIFIEYANYYQGWGSTFAAEATNFSTALSPLTTVSYS